MSMEVFDIAFRRDGHVVKTLTPDDLLRALRAVGVSKVDSIKLLHLAFDISLLEAKESVHLSATWSDRRADDDAFHDALYQSIKRPQPK